MASLKYGVRRLSFGLSLQEESCLGAAIVLMAGCLERLLESAPPEAKSDDLIELYIHLFDQGIDEIFVFGRSSDDVF